MVKRCLNACNDGRGMGLEAILSPAAAGPSVAPSDDSCYPHPARLHASLHAGPRAGDPVKIRIERWELVGFAAPSGLPIDD